MTGNGGEMTQISAIDKVTKVIFDAIDEVNMLLPPDVRLAKSTDTILFGSGGGLDSLGQINFLVALEQKIEENLSISINFMDVAANSQQDNPLATIETLTDYISSILQGCNDDCVKS